MTDAAPTRLEDFYPPAYQRLVGTLVVPVARVAAELGIAEGTVKSRLSRARAALAHALRPQEVRDE